MTKQLFGMKTTIFLIINVLCFTCMSSISGQSIRRSTLCSVATKYTNVGEYKVASTFGEKIIICGTFFDGTTYIRQGFQQPNDSQIMVPCFGSSFEVEILSTSCGTYFNFEYIGTADPQLASFNWHFGEDALPESSTDQNPEGITYTSTGSKTIVLEVAQDTCFEVVRLTMDVDAVGFGVNPVVTPILCRTEGLGAIDLEIDGGTRPYVIQWSDGNNAAQRTDLETGEYAYTVTDAAGCSSSDVVLIEGTDSLSVTSTIISASDTTARNGSIDVELVGGLSPYQYAWSDGSTESDRFEIKAGIYTLTVTDANGCENKFLFEVPHFAAAGPGTIINDVFTPNGDNINDTWVIRGLENFPDNELQIYNRWGDVVYKVKSYQSDWRGENNGGDLLPAGPYWYVIKLNNVNETIWSGSVTIIR